MIVLHDEPLPDGEDLVPLPPPPLGCGSPLGQEQERPVSIARGSSSTSSTSCATPTIAAGFMEVDEYGFPVLDSSFLLTQTSEHSQVSARDTNGGAEEEQEGGEEEHPEDDAVLEVPPLQPPPPLPGVATTGTTSPPCQPPGSLPGVATTETTSLPPQPPGSLQGVAAIQTTSLPLQPPASKENPPEQATTKAPFAPSRVLQVWDSNEDFLYQKAVESPWFPATNKAANQMVRAARSSKTSPAEGSTTTGKGRVEGSKGEKQGCGVKAEKGEEQGCGVKAEKGEKQGCGAKAEKGEKEGCSVKAEKATTERPLTSPKPQQRKEDEDREAKPAKRKVKEKDSDGNPSKRAKDEEPGQHPLWSKFKLTTGRTGLGRSYIQGFVDGRWQLIVEVAGRRCADHRLKAESILEKLQANKLATKEDAVRMRDDLLR